MDPSCLGVGFAWRMSEAAGTLRLLGSATFPESMTYVFQ